MVQFHIHFFKERTRKIDLEYLISFFETIEGVTVDIKDQSVEFVYDHPHLDYQAVFVITPKSKVPDIYRLSPKFLDLNFHLEMPILTPDYLANHMFLFVKKICDQFDFHIYNEMFEDVLAYKTEVVLKVFHMIKSAYIERNPVILKDYHLIEKNKLHEILRYTDDLVDLQLYYKDLDTYVPRYHILVENKEKIVYAIEWKENTLTVFPPHLDYIFYRLGQEIRVVGYEEVQPLFEKLVMDVPGFIKGTTVLPKKTSKKAFSIMKKTKFTKVAHTFIKTQMRYLLDK